jgi:hypothetical protein
LVNHNIYVYVRAMIEANISMFVKGVAPPALQQAVAVIGDLFDADAIAADLADRLAVDGGLDDFVGQGDPGAPVPFDAEDPR